MGDIPNCTDIEPVIQGAAPTKKEEHSSMTIPVQAAVWRLINDFWNGFDWDALDELVTADFVHRDNGEVRDRGAYKRLIAGFSMPFPDGRFTVEDVIKEEGKAAVRWTWRGIHKGEFRGIAPTGKRVEVPGITMFRLVNGKISEMWAAWDLLGLLRQLGEEPSAAPAG